MKFSNIASQRFDPDNLNSLIRFCLKNKYPLLVLAHVLLGIVIYLEPHSCKVYSILVFLGGLYFIIRNRDANRQALFASAYVTGSEVLVRMVDGASYEFAKYTVLIFALLGIAYSGLKRKSWIYVLYLLLLIPSLLLTNDFLQISRGEMNLLIMTISGPICLAFLSIYTFDKQVSFAQMSQILLLAAMPVITIATTIFLQSPDLRLINSVASNPAFSGGFGPNQVATALGLGMFLFFARAILNSGSHTIFVLNLLLGSFLAYVGLLTFSRGGMITGFCTILTFTLFVFFKSKSYGKSKTKTGLTAFLICFIAVFSLISYSTDGLLVKRYSGRTKLGQIRKDKPSDRGSIATKEVTLFFKNPILGVSVTEADRLRMDKLGRKMRSHSEITRLLAEHGLLGLINVMILIITPAWLLFRRQNVFLATFFVFWFLTINHSGMRLIAPAFFYALMLLQVDLSNVTFFSRLKSERLSYKKLTPAATIPNSI